IANQPLYKTTLQPFIYAVEHGLKAIIAENILEANTFLRKKTTFNGLLIKDATATTNEEITAQDVINSIIGGADIILLEDTYKNQMQIIDKVLSAVKEGIISEERVNESMNRIVNIKNEFSVGEMITYHEKYFQTERSNRF